MKVGFDASILAPHTIRSGTGRYALRVIEHLAKIEDIECVLFGAPGAERPPVTPEQFEWRTVEAPRLGKLSTFVAYQRVLPKMIRELGIEVWPPPRWELMLPLL